VFGQIEPIVFRRNEIATAPLLWSLMEQMRGCDTAIVQVDGNFLPRGAEPRIQPDVMIEIGAAMALYGRNFVCWSRIRSRCRSTSGGSANAVIAAMSSCQR
jgi:hypothetical protein